MAKLTLSDLSAFVNSGITLTNANWAALEAAIENTLSRDGTSPNAMGANLDMNSNRIINVDDAQQATDAVNLRQLSDSDATGAASAQLRLDLLATSGATLINFIQAGTLPTTRTLEAKVRELGVSTNDHAAIANSVDAGEAAGYLLVPTGTKTLSAGLSLADVILEGRAGSILEGTTGIDVLTANGFMVVNRLTLDTFRVGIVNSNTLASAIDLSILGNKFVDGGQLVNIESPTDRLLVLGNRGSANVGYQIRLGQNTQSLQAGWKGFAAAFNTFQTVTSAGTGAGAGGIISYSPFSRIIGNSVNGVVGGHASDEVFFYYTKGIGAVILGNTGDGVSGTGNKYGINLKGSPRGDTSTPQGYGATAAFNAIRQTAAGNASGIQMQADEQAIIGNWIDQFRTSVELGTSKVGMGIVALNRGISDGTASSEFMAGTIEGEMFTSALNVSKGGLNGTSIAVATGKTFERLRMIGEHHQGAAAAADTGVEILGTDTDSITNVDISHLSLDTFAAGLKLTNVKGATLSHVRFSDLTQSTRPYTFTTSKNIRGIDVFNTTLSTTDATATNVFEMGLSDGNVLHMKVRACSRNTDGSAAEYTERECIAKQEAGTATVVASKAQVNIAGTTVAIDFTIVSNRVRARVAGIAAQNWDHTVWVDFEVH